MEVWKKQFIRNLFPYSASRMDIERAYMIKHPHVPAKLYKYRKFPPKKCEWFSPNHLDDLAKNVLWMLSPNNFNDPYDAAVYFDTDRFLVENQSAAEFIESVNEMPRTVKAGGNWLPKKIVDPIPSGEWQRKITRELLKDSDAPHKDKLILLIEAFSGKPSDDSAKRMSDWFRSGYSVLSLSENSSSTLMGSHYSNSHKGFVIEYDFSRLDYNDLRRRLCFPVFYTKKPRDATRYMAKTDMTNYNCLFGQFMCLIKKDEWAYEKEWRIVHALGARYANKELPMPEPSAIFLGAQVAPDDEVKMRDLCHTRAIPLKKMEQRSGSYDLGVIDMPTGGRTIPNPFS
jgi:Protein of unknown function (DUF2971)